MSAAPPVATIPPHTIIAPTLPPYSVTSSEDEDEYYGEDIFWQETPQSTCFIYVGYDPWEEKLGVIFRDNDTRAYVYSDFSQSDWNAFISASSLGSYYNAHIKGQYDCERYDDADALRSNGR